MRPAHLLYRGGFALPDLLAAVAMAGLGIALLVPLIEKHRSREDQVKCANNLRQMGLAIHNFHDSMARFPTSPGGDDILGGGGIAYDSSGMPLGIRYQTAGWAFQILPYLEQNKLYKTSDAHADKKGDPDNIVDLAKLSPRKFPADSYNIDLFGPVGAVRKAVVPSYYCPARRQPARYGGLGRIDYAAAHPDKVPIPMKDGNYAGDAAGTLLRNAAGYHGVISARSIRVTFASILDGTSNTMMVAEKFMRPMDYHRGGPGDLLGWAEYGGLDTCRSTTTVAGWLHNPSRDRNKISPDQDVQFGSAHPDGLNSLFADGSVHQLRFNIDPNVFNALGHRDDGTGLDEKWDK